MPLDIVVGAQWGDEGKGRIVDLLSAKADYVARFNGGDNAGHTVTVGSQTYKLHLVPSGIVHPHTVGFIGAGVVVNPLTLRSEIETLTASGVDAGPQRLRISHAAHLITPAHRALDAAQERARGSGQIGTTGRGIGPAYTDKTSRQGIRVEEMLNLEHFRQRMTEHLTAANKTLARLFQAEPLDVAENVNKLLECAEFLRPYIADVGDEISQGLKHGKRILAEGAQGTLLDLDHGTYPFVTSSNPIAPAAFTGLGIGICPVERVIGVTKVFQTRVGAGPFPTEVFDDTAVRLRGTGANPWDEFGTTTGRPRRVGWLDLVLLRYAARINGLTELVLTKLDILSGLPELHLCTAYRADGKLYERLPFGPADLSPFEPIFAPLDGWTEDVSGIRTWEDLPEAAQHYVLRIQQLTGVPVSQVSVGPERDQVVDVML